MDIAVNGVEIHVPIVGAGHSPEFIYAVRTDRDIYPDPEHFGILYMSEEALQKVLGQSHIYNSIVLELEGSTSFDDVKTMLEEKCKPYGLLKMYKQSDQKSTLLLNQELEGMKAMSSAMPMIFVGVAAMILYIQLRRLIEKQRGQIGVLKAFGLSDKKLLWHYIGYAVLIGGTGAIAGVISGQIMVIPFTAMYQSMFNMPLHPIAFSMPVAAQGIAIALFFSIFAGWRGSRSVLAMEPAEAMRPATPRVTGKIALERISYLWNRWSMHTRMAIRNVFRNKTRSAFVCLGIVFTFALLGMPWSMKNAMDKMIFDQFKLVQTYDMHVAMSEPVPVENAIREMKRVPGVEQVEPLLEIPANMMHKGMEKRVVILGLPEESTLYHVRDASGNEVNVTGEGMILSQRLSELLGVDVGGYVKVDSPLKRRKQDSSFVQVLAVIPQYLGMNAYMTGDSAAAMIDQPKVATALMVTANRQGIEAIRSAYEDSRVVLSMEVQEEQIEKYHSLLEMFMAMIFIFAVFGVLTGFAVIFSSSMIALSERERELASLLVTGMSYKDVYRVVTLEQWILTGVGMIFGLPVMKGFILGMTMEMNNDVYAMPQDISALALVTAVAMTALSIWLAQQRVRKKIDQIDMVSALGIRE